MYYVDKEEQQQGVLEHTKPVVEEDNKSHEGDDEQEDEKEGAQLIGKAKILMCIV
jgi:hypothetical protein